MIIFETSGERCGTRERYGLCAQERFAANISPLHRDILRETQNGWPEWVSGKGSYGSAGAVWTGERDDTVIGAALLAKVGETS